MECVKTNREKGPVFSFHALYSGTLVHAQDLDMCFFMQSQ